MAPPKKEHEIRDPLYGFVRVTTEERAIIDLPCFQRLRHIHQLALQHLVYPSATHKRFEHSLGVMELAGRVFDIVTRPDHIVDDVRAFLEPILERREYWRTAVRMAALLHDVGHLPFSHAAEGLLPKGTNHETFTVKLIQQMQADLARMTPALDAADVIKLAVGDKARAMGYPLNQQDQVLAEIIVGDNLGVDRIDYLLRDSYHAGVEYGRFDYLRLLDSIRILMHPIDKDRAEPRLGITEGGLRMAEAMALARFSIYSQVYFHPVRKVYDIHLQDFLSAWLHQQDHDHYPDDLDFHQNHTDNELFAAMRAATRDSQHACHQTARRVVERNHFRCLIQLEPPQIVGYPDGIDQLKTELVDRFGADRIRAYPLPRKAQDKNKALPTSDDNDFPVWRAREELAVSAKGVSELLTKVPSARLYCVYVDPDILSEAREWLKPRRKDLFGF